MNPECSSAVEAPIIVIELTKMLQNRSREEITALFDKEGGSAQSVSPPAYTLQGAVCRLCRHHCRYFGSTNASSRMCLHWASGVCVQ